MSVSISWKRRGKWSVPQNVAGVTYKLMEAGAHEPADLFFLWRNRV